MNSKDKECVKDHALNFRTLEGQESYIKAYNESLNLIEIPYEEREITTSYGITHCLIMGNSKKKPLVLLHAASCGSTIWYKNVKALGRNFHIYAIDLITESSKSLLYHKCKGNKRIAHWLDETVTNLNLNRFFLAGLSIGGWNATNYATYYPSKVEKLVLISPVQSFAPMYKTFFFKIMKMGFHPTRENVENYIGWGNEKEESLPDSIIEQFTISVMNMNSNVAFPKMLRKGRLKRLHLPVMILLGEKEFAFSIKKAKDNASSLLNQYQICVIKDASHLLPVSKPKETNKKIVDFLK